MTTSLSAPRTPPTSTTDLTGKKQNRPIITREGAVSRAPWDRAILAALADAGIALEAVVEATP